MSGASPSLSHIPRSPPFVAIRVVDLETTGFGPDAGVCEIGFCDVTAQCADLVGGPCDWIVVPGTHSFVNPLLAIPPEASAVHHIVDSDVAGAPPFGEVARALLGPAGDGRMLLAAHSAKFERQFLTPEIVGPAGWICTYKAALRLWPEAPSHANQALRYWRKPEGLDRAVASAAHRAFPDAYVTAHLLRDMLNDGATVEELVAWSAEPALQVRCHIGKWRGTPWREVDDGFLEWVLARDFDEDVIFTARTELTRRAAGESGDDADEDGEAMP